jgi:ribosomal protein S17
VSEESTTTCDIADMKHEIKQVEAEEPRIILEASVIPKIVVEDPIPVDESKIIEKANIEEVKSAIQVPEPEQSEVKSLSVTVISNTNEKSMTGININDFAVLVHTPNKKYKVGDIIKIKYEGVIGTTNFKVYI